jgi:hypothetical protein
MEILVPAITEKTYQVHRKIKVMLIVFVDHEDVLQHEYAS